jgi:hypothetical protein
VLQLNPGGDTPGVYVVSCIVNEDQPAVRMLAWADDDGTPRPLSSGLVEEVKKWRPEARGRRGPDADEHNEQLREETERQRREQLAAISDDHRPKIERGRVTVSRAAPRSGTGSATASRRSPASEAGSRGAHLQADRRPSSPTGSPRRSATRRKLWVQARHAWLWDLEEWTFQAGERERRLHRRLAGRRQPPDHRLPHRDRRLRRERRAAAGLRGPRRVLRPVQREPRPRLRHTRGVHRRRRPAARRPRRRRLTGCSSTRSRKPTLSADGDPTGLPEGTTSRSCTAAKRRDSSSRTSRSGRASTTTSPRSRTRCAATT